MVEQARHAALAEFAQPAADGGVGGIELPGAIEHGETVREQRRDSMVALLHGAAQRDVIEQKRELHGHRSGNGCVVVPDQVGAAGRSLERESGQGKADLYRGAQGAVNEEVKRSYPQVCAAA